MYGDGEEVWLTSKTKIELKAFEKYKYSNESTDTLLTLHKAPPPPQTKRPLSYPSITYNVRNGHLYIILRKHAGLYTYTLYPTFIKQNGGMQGYTYFSYFCSNT